MANVHIPKEHMMWIHRNNKPVIYVCQDIPDFELKIPVSSVNMDNQQANFVIWYIFFITWDIEISHLLEDRFMIYQPERKDMMGI